MQARAELIEQIADDVCAHKQGGPARHLLRVAPAGDGGRFAKALGAALEARERPVIRLDLPDYEIDASEHVLGQLCQAIGVDATPMRAWDRRLTIHERVRKVTSGLAQQDDPPVIVLYIPRSWFRRPEDPRRSLPDNPTSVLTAFLDADLDAVVTSASVPAWLQRQMNVVAEDLPMPETGMGYLLEPRRWGQLEAHAKQLASIVGDGVSGTPPLVLRLGVACLALGQPKRTIEQVLQKPEPYRELVIMLQDTVKQHDAWRPALSRLTLPRFPVPKRLLGAISRGMSDEERALAACLIRSEGEGEKADEALREIVGTPRHPEPRVNEQLRKHYRASDGAVDARAAVQAGSVLAWLEGNHHRVHEGPDALEEIKSLSRLIQYERAWSLSVEFKQYEAAAAVYRAILDEHPEDAYSHHYLAWNLDRAGKDGRTVWQEYKAAIDREQDNPWYNSRFITFLRDNGFRADAHKAWQRAVAHVLPGTWAKRVKLPRHFHHWVARSALDVGDLEFAEKVLTTLTPQDFKTYPKLAEMHEELLQYREIERLGEPIYPPSVPVAKRWKEPLLLRSPILEPKHRGRSTQLEKVSLLDWYPGRVESIAEGKVHLVLAEPQSRRLFKVEVDEQAIVRMAHGEPPQLGRFLEYGGYEGQIARVQYHPPRRARTEAEQERFERGLRYLRDEATPGDA